MDKQILKKVRRPAFGLILFVFGIALLLSTQVIHADYYETSRGILSRHRCIMYNYLQDGYTVLYYGHIDRITAGDQYIEKYKRKDDGTTRDAVYQIDFNKSIKSGDYIISFVDGDKNNTIIITDSFDTSISHEGGVDDDLDGYFTTRKFYTTKDDRIALLGDVRFNYIDEGTHTFYLRLRDCTGMVMGNSVDVDSDGSISAKVIDEKTMEITLDESVASGVHQATLTFKRGNPWLQKVLEKSIIVEFTDRDTSGSMDIGFFIPSENGSFEIYQAGRGDVTYSSGDGSSGLTACKPGNVTINTGISNSIAYAPEMNGSYKSIKLGNMTSDNPWITVSCKTETVDADDWCESYRAIKPYIIATLSDDAPIGKQEATIKGQVLFANSNGGYEIIYHVIFEKDAQPVDRIFTDVSANAWYKNYLQKAYSKGIIGGMSSTTYGPTSNLTHAQIVVMVANLRNLQNGGTYDFQANKVEGGHWCSAFLNYCKAEGIIDSRFDGTLDENVNRGEMAYYFAHALSGDSYKNKKTPELTDISENPYADDIIKLASADIVGGYDDKTYRADHLVTRAEAAVFISNIIDAAETE